MALPAIFPVLFKKTELIQRYADIGTINLVGLAVALLFQLLVGHHARTHHYRRYLALDALIVGLSLVLLTLSKSFFILVILYIGVRMGTSIYHPIGVSWISHTFAGKRLDRAMGLQFPGAATAGCWRETRSGGWRKPQGRFVRVGTLAA